MSEPDLIEKVDFFLKRMCEGHGFDDIGDTYIHFFDPNVQDHSAYRSIIDRLERERLAVKNGDNGTRMVVTDFGRRVYANGGYKLFLHEVQKEEAEEKKFKEVETLNTKLELRLNEWYFKTRWWPLIISVIALIVSIVALFEK